MRYACKIVLRTIFFIVTVLPSLAYAVDAHAMLMLGTQAAEFNLGDFEGKEYSLSQFSQKKAVVLLFWSTWSANSQKALKRFEEFHRKYQDKGIQIIGINAENQTISKEDMENVRKVLKDMDITFPAIFDRELKTFHDYGIIALPSTVIAAEGKIVYELPGFPLVATEDMFDFLRTLAGEVLIKKSEPAYKPRHDAIADANLARGFVKKKRYEMAYPLFNKAIEKDPAYALPYLELSRLCETEGKLAEAEDILKKALLINAENVALLSEMGRILSKAGRTKEAIAILEKAVSVNSYTPAHYYFAYATAKDGRLKDALAAFDKAIALNPFDPEIYALRAEIHKENRMAAEASSDYRKSLELILKISN
jgi:tetratricopeptide (TPR) repeat protein